MHKVLLTNAQQRKTLAAVRSLGQKGIETYTAETTRFHPTGFSRFCGCSIICPDPRRAPREYYNWLVDILKHYSCDVIFPMDDDTMEIVMEYKDELEQLCLLPLPSKESYNIASDKGVSTLLAMECGVPCPKTVVLQSLDQLLHEVGQLSYPLVIKPRKSAGSRGFRLINTLEELLEVYPKIHADHPIPIIQEYVGKGDEKYSVCLLYDRSHQLKASFVQKQLRTYPVESGPSCIQESVYRPDLVEMAVPFMEKLKWIGVAELEFMLDHRDGKMKFLEINPRFWNSLYAAILSGVDFPWLLFKIAFNEEIEPVFTYKVGMRCRWLLPGDILHFISNRDRFKIDPPFLAGKRHNVFDDIICKDDPLPTLGFILACFRYLFNINMWKFMFRR